MKTKGNTAPQNRIKIYIGGFELPDRTPSAVRVIGNALLLKELNYKVIIIGRLPRSERSENPKRSTNINGFDCYDWEFQGRFDTLKSVVREVGENNCYAVIAYNFRAIDLLRVINYTRNMNIIPVADCTEWYGWGGRSVFHSMYNYIDTEFRMRFLAKKTKNIICSSSFLRNYYSNINNIVWPFSIDSKLDHWQPLSNIQKHTPILFVYSGSPGSGMSKDKINLSIVAFYYLKKNGYDFVYKIIGITKEQYTSVFPEHSYMIEFLDGSVDFIGRVSHSRSLEFLKYADFMIFIRPNNRVSNAGFPTKVVEAITLGIPIITNNVGDAGMYIKNKYNGLLFEDIDSNIEESLEESLNMSQDDIFKMKESARKLNPFSIQNMKGVVGKFMNELT